jgi:hypothetical protein
MRANARNAFRFLLQWQALVWHDGRLKTLIDGASQGAEISHGILSARTLFQTRSWIDGIGLKARRRITGLSIGTNCLGKGLHFEIRQLRTPGVDNPDGTKVRTCKVHTRSVRWIRRVCLLRNRNLPPKFDELDSSNSAVDLEITLRPTDFIRVTIPQRSLGLASCRGNNLARNDCGRRTKLNCRHKGIALLLKRLTQQCHRQFLRVARHFGRRQDIDLFHPIECTGEQIDCLGRHSAARGIHGQIRKFSSACTRIANNHEALLTPAVGFEIGVLNRLRMGRNVIA